MTNDALTNTTPTKKPSPLWVFDLLIILVLVGGGYLRATGLFWGEYQYLHPDERFLIWVGTDITPIKSIDTVSGEKSWISVSEYFDTANSPLNPNNRGHGFYVYGTLPMFITRYAVEWLYGHSGFDPMTDVGRSFSAAADLLIVLLVYMVSARLYNKKVGILAAAFSAFAVLQIQQSHFFTMDNFVNLFSFFAFYFAIRIQTDRRLWTQPQRVRINTTEESGTDDTPNSNDHFSGIRYHIEVFFRHPLFLSSLAFGIAFGMAMASKLNAAPVALLLPAAVLIRVSAFPKQERLKYAIQSIKYLVVAGVVSFLIFRIFQPYAFNGPGFLGIEPNSLWVSQIREQRSQASIHVDFPPAMQWARRSVSFSAYNLTIWGLGLPLGILSWIGFFWVGWQILKGNWQTHALIWGWTVIYFIWQSLAFNPTMRYQLPIYPTLVIFAAWAVISLYNRGVQVMNSRSKPVISGAAFKLIAILTGISVLILSAAYAFGFTRIYDRPITRLEASRWIFQNIPGPINLHIETGEGTYNQPLPFPYTLALTPEQPYTYYFKPHVNGVLKEIYLPHVNDLLGESEAHTLRIKINEQAGEQGVLVDQLLIADFSFNQDPHGDSHTLTTDGLIPLREDTTYALELVLESEAGEITLEGATLANEGEWDDAVPYRVEGYDPFGGIYPPDINFNMYWDETPEKLDRFLRIIEQSDFIAITSSRQWGSLPRMPERFPLSTIYYRELLGCPDEREIEWCYNVAKPGMFEGDLGFDLVESFQSDPTIASIRINDQFAEEAFTVYDHPKVFIFQKNKDYNQELVREILGSVDFSRIIRKPPLQYESYPTDLTLPVSRLSEQLEGGTWSELFNSNGILNAYPVVGAIAWYLSLTVLGLCVYPIVRIAFPGLSDRGYPLARIVGLLLLSFIVWIAGSIRIPFSKTTITIAGGILLIAGISLAYYQRNELKDEWRNRRKYFLIIEGLILVFFIVDLLIRYGNPDLWHPWKGGEKPMDFAYLNALLKSSSFPPYDPWYAGGYLNYYYYGFMLVGVLVKWLGIVPSIAYNFIIPTIFSLIAIGAFSIAWNITSASAFSDDKLSTSIQKYLPYITGIAGALGMAVLGNLGTVKMIVLGFQRLVAPGGVIEDVGFLTRLLWAAQGFIKAVGGASLPYGVADWYWLPSRIIPANGDTEPITEFPFFTVLYGDPHAHLFALPIALLAIAFALSIILARGRWRSVLAAITGICLGGLIVGALRPTNTWDFYTYLALGIVAVGYALLTYYRSSPKTWGNLKLLSSIPESGRKLIAAFGGVLIFAGLAYILYQPYAQWYAQGYTAVDIWQGSHTPLHA
ncbi:MAG: DUF2298 domain-containing protein, partial [Chloroflexota bacterium]|nr:DUF2298 domain-containing protein [Chloroflexota bacterium]